MASRTFVVSSSVSRLVSNVSDVSPIPRSSLFAHSSFSFPRPHPPLSTLLPAQTPLSPPCLCVVSTLHHRVCPIQPCVSVVLFSFVCAPLDLLFSGRCEVCSLHPQGLSHELLQGTQDAWRQTERILTALCQQPGEGTPAAPSGYPRPFGIFSIFLSMDTSLPSKCSGVSIPSMTGSPQWIIFKDMSK